MLKNYLIIAWRNLLKSKGFSFINIAGLAVGLACFILTALWVVNELSYDRYNEKADRIYRINSFIRFGGNDLSLAVCSDPMGATLKRDYPQVEEFVRFYTSDGSKLVKKGNEYITEANVANADSTLFNVFTLPAIAGDTKTALNEPNSVVITESTAKKYFQSVDNALGKTIETNDKGSTLYKVTAVIKDIPRTSHFNFDFIFSMDNVEYGFGNYLSHNFQTYIVLKEGTNYREFEKNFAQVIEKYIIPQAQQFMDIKSIADFEKAGNRLNYQLIPLTDIHLKSNLFPELGVNGNIQYVYIFSAIALFVLIIACINFMNLSTARSANRAKEVGIRKVLGTERASLIRQFLVEATLTALIALLLGLGIAYLVLPFFNDLSAKSLSIASLFNARILPFLLLLPFAVGLLAGSYPAFFLSKFQPITVLKGKIASGAKSSLLRSGLVVFQFFISIALIIGTIVVYRQLNHIQQTKIGFNKEQVLIIDGTNALGNNTEAFKNEILQMQGVKSGSFAGYLPVTPSARSDNSYSTKAAMTAESGFNMQSWRIDYDYIPTLGMDIVKGRNFSKEFGTDSSAVIINETTAKLLGYEDPIGKTIYAGGPGGDGSMQALTIVGVVKDFNFESLRKNVTPLCFLLGRSSWTTAFRINTSKVQDLVKQVEARWKTMAPGMPFSYRFLDEAFDSMYRNEQRVGQLGLSLSMIAILVACLGLFGLATYIAEQRTKEIGIRKVLGANVTGLISMLSVDFIKLVSIAFIIAVPFAWFVMNSWLQDFAYRIKMEWWVFALAGLIVLLIALITVSSQAIKAALMNPVKSLRTE